MPDVDLTTPIRKLRLLLKLRQSDVADGIGIARPNYAQIELGRPCDPKTAEKIVEYFGPPLEESHVLFPYRFERFLDAQPRPEESMG
jgi:transcriptional regulator with XRE-family HTH domain